MRRSSERVLTTHMGSIPRRTALEVQLLALERGEPIERDEMDGLIASEVARVVEQQARAGIDIANDGEQSKASFHRYRTHRLTGFEMVDHEPDRRQSRRTVREARDFPEFYERWNSQWRSEREGEQLTLCCTGSIEWAGTPELERDIANLAAATRGHDFSEIFMTSISPATYAPPNLHYETDDEYLDALADAMAVEYETIIDAGLLLQIDAPDLTTMYRMADLTRAEYLETTERSVAAINRATRNIDPGRARVHVCWGADEAPHHRDVPLRDIVHLLLRLRPTGLAVPGANGRHAHEWRVWADVPLPDEKVLIPGVIDSTTNIIEHPEAVAERIERYASVVGRERLIAGVDCGFGTAVDVHQVDPRIVWAKLAALADGAKLASRASIGT